MMHCNKKEAYLAVPDTALHINHELNISVVCTESLEEMLGKGAAGWGTQTRKSERETGRLEFSKRNMIEL